MAFQQEQQRLVLRTFVISPAIFYVNFFGIEMNNCQPTSPETINQICATSGNLDLMRSLAALYVLIFHVLLYFGLAEQMRLGGLGHWGVLVFFVHTSLVLMRSLARQDLRAPQEPKFVEFMLRRCFRLLPLSVLAVFTIAALGLPVGHLHAGQFLAVPIDGASILANLFLIQNWTGAESLEAPLWSLPYEMQMYLVLPALFSVARTSSVGRLVFLWGVAVMAGFALSRFGWLDRFQMLAYVPCFMTGVIAFKLGGRRPRLPWSWWPAAFGALTVLYLLHPSLLVGWLCCFALGLILSHFHEMPAGSLQQFFHFIARYSYGLYLSHFLFMWFAFVALGSLSWVARAVVFVVATLIAPIALYHWVEAPMMRLGGTLLRKRARVLRGRSLQAAEPA